MPDINMSPIMVENRILELSNWIAKGTAECDRRYQAYMRADHEYDYAYAKAFLEHKGPQTEKRYAAEVATYDLRQARDMADALHRHANRTAEALRAELMAMQSVNKSVLATFAAAGIGER